jgi:hypothetical protein
VAEVFELEDAADLLRLDAVSSYPQRPLHLRLQRLSPLAAPVARQSAARISRLRPRAASKTEPLPS